MEHTSDALRRRYLLIRLAAFGGLWVLACLYLWQAFVIPPPARPSPVTASEFPVLIGILMLVAATGMLANAACEYLKARRGAAVEPTPDDVTIAVLAEEGPATTGPHGEELVTDRLRFVVALGGTVVYVALFFPLGYLISTLLFLIGLTYFFWRRLVWSIVVAVGLTIAIGWIFDALGVRLPVGLLGLPF